MFISGVSTQKIEKVLHELDEVKMSALHVSVLCAELDAQVQVFRERRLTLAYPYAMLDALYVSIREDRNVFKHAVVIAYDVNENGTREVIGIDVSLRAAYSRLWGNGAAALPRSILSQSTATELCVNVRMLSASSRIPSRLFG